MPLRGFFALAQGLSIDAFRILALREQLTEKEMQTVNRSVCHVWRPQEIPCGDLVVRKHLLLLVAKVCSSSAQLQHAGNLDHSWDLLGWATS